MIFNNYSIVTSLYENIIIGYSSNIYVSKMYIMCFTWNIWAVCKKIVSYFIIGDFMADTYNHTQMIFI